jgi:hypothetical protein
MTTQTIPQRVTIDEERFFEVITPAPVTAEDVAKALEAERDLVQEYLDQYALQECLVFDAEAGSYWNSCPWPRTHAPNS